jgi:hypothetical protein
MDFFVVKKIRCSTSNNDLANIFNNNIIIS